MTSKLIDMAGMYRIVAPNKKAYIGITTVSFRERFHAHRHLARVLPHKTLIAKAIAKYGDAMVFEPLIVSFDRNYLMSLEREAISVYDTLAPKGYNRSVGGEEPPVLDAAARAKISARHTGRKITWDCHGGCAPCEVIVDDVVYPSIALAADAHGISRSSARVRFFSTNFPGWVAPHIAKRKTRIMKRRNF